MEKAKKSAFKVLFYVNGSKEKDGIVPVMGRMIINGAVSKACAIQSASTQNRLDFEPYNKAFRIK